MVICFQKPPGMREEDEPEEEEEEELGHAETYAEYMPMKCEYYYCLVYKECITEKKWFLSQERLIPLSYIPEISQTK